MEQLDIEGRVSEGSCCGIRPTTETPLPGRSSSQTAPMAQADSDQRGRQSGPETFNANQYSQGGRRRQRGQ